MTISGCFRTGELRCPTPCWRRCCCCCPCAAGEYLLTQATFVFINGTVALGLMLLVGYTGLISLGHAAFFAVGAYTVAVLELRGIPFCSGAGSAPDS